MGTGLCCGHDRDLTNDTGRTPILVKRSNEDKSKSHSNHRVYCLEIKIEGKNLNCEHYSDSPQCLRDKQRIYDPKNFNVVHLEVLKGSQVGKKITIPMLLRKEDDVASLKLSRAGSSESASNLSLRENIKQRSSQYQDSENPGNDIDLKTSRIPIEVVTALSRWIKSENIGRKAITEILERDAWFETESTATGNEMSRKNCISDLEIPCLSSSTNLYPDNSCITPVINHSSTTSVISKLDRTPAPYQDKWYASKTWMDDGSHASESSDFNSEEHLDFHGEDFVAFSKTQLERKRSRSLSASKIFSNLPRLSDTLRDLSEGFWTNGNDEKVSPDQEALVSRDSENKSSTVSPGSMNLIMADIELLEQSIKEKTVTINELRKESVHILTTGYESDLDYEFGGDIDDMSLWLDVEKKVNRLENEKRDLVGKKDILVSQLQKLSYLKPDVLQNPLLTAQERPPKTKLEVSNSYLHSRNNSSRLSFRELRYEDSLER